MKSLAEELFDHIAACFSGIWIQSYEHTDAIADIAALAGTTSGSCRPGMSAMDCQPGIRNQMNLTKQPILCRC